MLPVSTTYGVLVFACKTARKYIALWFAPTLWACMSTCSGQCEGRWLISAKPMGLYGDYTLLLKFKLLADLW